MDKWSGLERMHCVTCGMTWDNPEFNKKIRPKVLPNGIVIGNDIVPTYYHPNRQSIFCGPTCATNYYEAHNKQWDNYEQPNQSTS